jgi:hypothetical protein
VDRSVASIDFAPLAYEKVYLDSRFLQFKNDSEVSTNYVISSLRQQMVVAGCLLQDSTENADYIVEARVGTMGADGHDINYGIPASSSVNAAASLLSSSIPLPTLPEISLARRTQQSAAVKIAVFAYSRDTRMPVWQSGTAIARSKATGTWILGAGPFKRGSIYDETEFAGKKAFGNRLKAPGKTDLVSADDVYRGPATWDPKLREKVESGKHLSPPNFEEGLDESRLEVASESGKSEAR